MRLCSHVITCDAGLAPNPFHGYCTSALCTPSHGKAKLGKGDWLIGNSPVEDGYRLVYAMCISEVLRMNKYFHDERFERKKPDPDGSSIEQCGDNLYYRDDAGQWRRLPSRFHNDCGKFAQDVGTHPDGNKVFVAEHFYYFGLQRVAIPPELSGVIKRGRNFSYPSNSLPHLADAFVEWLEANHEPGILGTPRHIKDRREETGPMITGQCADGAWQALKTPCRSGSCR